MAKRKYDIRNLNEAVDSSFELDLAPMLALMVTLIPIMLLSTVFVRVTVIDTPLPQVVQEAIQKDLNKKDRQVNLTLRMHHKQGFQLQVQKNGRVKTVKIPKTGGAWNLTRLHQELVQVKLAHPAVYKLDLVPTGHVPYDDIVKVMDEARTIKDKDTKIKVKDVETDVMFPNVVFANVVEG